MGCDIVTPDCSGRSPWSRVNTTDVDQSGSTVGFWGRWCLAGADCGHFRGVAATAVIHSIARGAKEMERMHLVKCIFWYFFLVCFVCWHYLVALTGRMWVLFVYLFVILWFWELNTKPCSYCASVVHLSCAANPSCNDLFWDRASLSYSGWPWFTPSPMQTWNLWASFLTGITGLASPVEQAMIIPISTDWMGGKGCGLLCTVGA